MAATCKARDGSVITDGQKATLQLAYDTEMVEVVGVVHSFLTEVDSIAVLEAQLAELKARQEIRWEIVTGDAHHPAVGFLPENVLTKK